VLLVSHREPRISVYERSNAWSSQEFLHSTNVFISSMNIRFSVDEVYAVLAQMK
jgi:hypothetical protein